MLLTNFIKVDGSTVTASLQMQADQTAGAMFRWWVPAATAMAENADVIEDEIVTIAETGYQGVEISVLTASGDLENYGWGTAGWVEFLKLVYSLAQEYGLTVDVTVTCGWPISLPAQYAYENYDALEKNLYNGDYATIDMNSGTIIKNTDEPLSDSEDLILYSDKNDSHTAEDPLNSRTLQSLSVAKIVGNDSVDKGQQYYQWAAQLRNGKDGTAVHTLVDPDSLVTLTEGKDYILNEETGSVTITWRPESEGEYRIFSYWMGFSGSTSNKGTIDNNYYVDYLTPDGVKAFTDFWEDHILYDDELKDLIGMVGMSLFEDSLEFGNYFGTDRLEWGTTFLQEFKERMGYDLSPYLPLLEGQSMGGTTNTEYYEYEMASYNEQTGQYTYSDVADRIRNDLSQVYTELFDENHISLIKEWGKQYNITYRQQACTFNYDAAYISAVCDYPDVETLGFFEITSDWGKYEHGYDKSRIVSAGAHMGDKNIISSECGALPQLSYRLTWAKMMEYIQLQYALGANRMIFHGYSHSTGGSSWPGYEGFGTGLADNWGERNPSWEYETSVAEYMDRAQDILRSGDPVVDIAIYNERYSTYGPIWEDEALQQAGYSYEFISETLLGLDSAYVEDGILAPGDGNYKTLIFNEQTYISLDTAQKILNYLDSNVKILVIGNFPSKVTSFNNWESDEAILAEIITSIMAHPNTLTAESESDAVDVMMANGITANAGLSQSADIITAHREIDGGDYYYMYNDSGQTVKQDITLSGIGNVYLIDLWSGDVTLAANYKVDAESGTVTRNFTFQANESIMVAVTKGNLYKVSGTVPLIEEEDTAVIAENADSLVKDGKVWLKAEENGEYHYQKYNGEAGQEKASGLPDAMILSEGWNLTVERWENNTDTIITYDTKKTMTQVEELEELIPWSQIDVLGEDVSGIGFYTNTFTLPESWSAADGAVLDLKILDDKNLGCSLAKVTVNGTIVYVDQILFRVDIGNLLKPGESNTIEIEVASTLANQLTAYGRLTYDTMEYGLLGATLIPYQLVELYELTTTEPIDPSESSNLSDPIGNISETSPTTGDKTPIAIWVIFFLSTLILIEVKFKQMTLKRK